MTRRGRSAFGRGTRWVPPGVDRGLLLLGVAVLLGTVGVLAVTVARHLGGLHAPVLPVSWCRSAADLVLPPLTGARWLTSWQVDRVATAVLVGVAAVYLACVASVARRGRRWPVWRTLTFLAGLGICLLAVSSAVGVYDMALFTTHMIGHLMLVMVAPPLLVAGRPLVLALHAVGNPWHTRLKRFFRGPLVSWWFSAPVALATYLVVIVGTHLTGLMDAIMVHPWAGQVEHLAYVLVGYQFFSVALGDEPYRWSLTPLTKEFLLALAMGVDTFTGVVLFQSDQAIAMDGVAGGIDPVVETNNGGAIMWVGGDGIMVIVMIIVALLWLGQPDLRRLAASGWMEQARLSTFVTHTGGIRATAPAPGTSTAVGPVRRRAPDLDDDDQALDTYNAWLRGLADRPPSR
jgi:putative copper resistance protein D